MSEQIASKLHAMGFSIESEFVPFSMSKNKGEKYPSLNWIVTLKYNDREVLTTDYMQGMAHCPAYSKDWSGLAYKEDYIKDNAITFECRTGIVARQFGGVIKGANMHVPSPTIDEFLYCIVSDSSVLDYGEFESWASDYGFDPDSRKAEEIYRECLSQALKLQSVIGTDKLSELRELFQNY